jgi:hypothetical protein
MSVPPKDAIEVMEQGVLSYVVLDDGFGPEIILVYSNILLITS